MIITAIVCILFDWPCLVWRWWYAEICSSFGVCCSTVPGLQCCFCCRLSARCVCFVYTLVWFGGSFVCFVFQHTRWCMSSIVHSLTPDLTIFQLMWTVAPWSHFFRWFALLQCDRWQCIYRTLEYWNLDVLLWIVKLTCLDREGATH